MSSHTARMRVGFCINVRTFVALSARSSTSSSLKPSSSAKAENASSSASEATWKSTKRVSTWTGTLAPSVIARSIVYRLITQPESFASPKSLKVFRCASETGVPVEYPDALKPQSWAAAAPLLALRTVLGLDPADERLRWKARLPPDWRALALTNVGFRGKYVDLR